MSEQKQSTSEKIAASAANFAVNKAFDSLTSLLKPKRFLLAMKIYSVLAAAIGGVAAYGGVGILGFAGTLSGAGYVGMGIIGLGLTIGGGLAAVGGVLAFTAATVAGRFIEKWLNKGGEEVVKLATEALPAVEAASKIAAATLEKQFTTAAEPATQAAAPNSAPAPTAPKA